MARISKCSDCGYEIELMDRDDYRMWSMHMEGCEQRHIRLSLEAEEKERLEEEEKERPWKEIEAEINSGCFDEHQRPALRNILETLRELIEGDRR